MEQTDSENRNRKGFSDPLFVAAFLGWMVTLAALIGNLI